MTRTRQRLRAVSLAVLVVLSAFVGTVAMTGVAAAATNTSISPDDDDAGASDVTYTARGNVELSNQDTLQHVDVHLGPADVSAVGSGDVQLYVDGNEYTDGFSQFSASSGTVEFKLGNSRSLSDGDPVRVVVADVTNPSDDFEANATLHDSGDQQWQEFADTVVIDTPPDISYSNLGFDDASASGTDTTVDVGEDLTVSATVSNDGEQSGSYDADLKVDGAVRATNSGTIAGNSEKTTSFVTDFDSTGAYDVTIQDLGTMEVTVTGPLEIVDGEADPSTVSPGTTVDTQQVFVEVANVSQDGDTDTHYVEFPDALASGLSVNSVSANATSITSSPNLVDGYDSDGVDDTVKFATSGDGGGDIPLNLTVDVSVDYPDTEATYGIDARTEDSDGDVDTQSDVVSITATSSSEDPGGSDDPDDGSTDDGSTDDGTDDGSNDGGSGDGTYSGGYDYGGDSTMPGPTLVEFDVTAQHQDVDVVVQTAQKIDTLRVDIDGAAEKTLTRPAFRRTKWGTDYVYVADVSNGTVGTFEGTLTEITNETGNLSRHLTDNATAELAVGPTASAQPPWVGIGDSRHRFSIPVSNETPVANETLTGVDVGYSDAFLDAGGSVSSVSDDQNVVTLRVVAGNGTVKSELGGTDAVTVNVVDGTVALDLSDVDSARKPTLEPGDTVVVGLRPVTNPESAGSYATGVGFESSAGHNGSVTTSLRIQATDTEPTETAAPTTETVTSSPTDTTTETAPPQQSSSGGLGWLAILLLLGLVGAALAVYLRRQ